MKQTLMVPGIAVASLLLLPHALSAQAADTKSPKSVAMAMATPGTFTALLTGPMGSSQASGIATLTGTTITVSWRDDQPGSRRMWSVRRGTCTQDDGPLEATEARGDFTVAGTGHGTSAASLTVLPDAEHPLHVVVHSATASETTPATATGAANLACGVLWDGTPQSRPARRAAPAATEHVHPAPTAAPSTPAMDHSAMDHAAMDHSAAKAPANEAKAPGSQGETANTPDAHAMHNMDAMDAIPLPALRDSSAAHLRKLYRTMLADPVIRERVEADSVLRQMVSKKPTSPAKPSAPKKATPAKATPAKAAPAPKTGMDHSMDHSKMSGMKKPPA